MNVFYRLNGVNSADAGAYSLTGTTPIERATTTFSGLSILKTATATLEVGAVYTSGTKGVRLSRIATVITYTPAPALPPAAPSNLVATASTSSLAIALTWNDNSTDETEFQILRGLSTSTMSHLASTTAGVTTYNNTGLASSTTYYYQVRSYNASGYSTTSSNFAFATTGAPPSAPSGLTATASTTPNRVFLNWTNTSGTENRWTLQRSTSSPISGFNFLAYLTGFGVTSHTDSTVASSTTYYYRVFSGNAFGTSTQSNVASTTTF
jgi:predicted phage tail protein